MGKISQSSGVSCFGALSRFVFILIAIIATQGCEGVENAAYMSAREASGESAGKDQIPWKPLSSENIRASFEQDRWIFVDCEGMATYETIVEYRESEAVGQRLGHLDIDCYLFRIDEGSDEIDASNLWEAEREINIAMRDIPIGRGDNRVYGVFFRLSTRQAIAVVEGTEDELIRILDEIEEFHEVPSGMRTN